MPLPRPSPLLTTRGAPSTGRSPRRGGARTAPPPRVATHPGRRRCRDRSSTSGTIAPRPDARAAARDRSPRDDATRAVLHRTQALRLRARPTAPFVLGHGNDHPGLRQRHLPGQQRGIRRGARTTAWTASIASAPPEPSTRSPARGTRPAAPTPCRTPTPAPPPGRSPSHTPCPRAPTAPPTPHSPHPTTTQDRTPPTPHQLIDEPRQLRHPHSQPTNVRTKTVAAFGGSRRSTTTLHEHTFECQAIRPTRALGLRSSGCLRRRRERVGLVDRDAAHEARAMGCVDGDGMEHPPVSDVHIPGSPGELHDAHRRARAALRPVRQLSRIVARRRHPTALPRRNDWHSRTFVT